MKTFPILMMSALLVPALVACNQSDPMESSGSGSNSASEAGTNTNSGSNTNSESNSGSGSESGSGSAEEGSESGPSGDPYYPLADGGTWTYRHVAADATQWDEVINMIAVTYDGQAAFEAEDNDGPNGQNSIATFVDVGGQTLRVHKEVFSAGVLLETVDYDPGFLRFDQGWTEGEVVQWMYDRTAFDPMGVVASENVRMMVFTVESMSTSVDVPAGTFDCVQFLRERVDTGERKRFWFARGVGKIKHETLGTGSSEELLEYSIP